MDGGRIKKQKRREWMAGVGLFVYLIWFGIRIPLSHIIGDKGIGFWSVGMEVFLVVSLVFSYSISKAVTVLVRYRVKRELFKNAQRIWKNALFLAVIFGLLAAAGVFFFADFIADVIVLEHMSYMAVVAVAPAIFLSAVMGALKGYFQGLGFMIPVVHSKILEKIVMCVSSLIFGMFFYDYGIKVGQFLKNEEMAAAYGALGAAFGVTIACVLGMIHLFFLRFIYVGARKQRIMQDTSKNTESGARILVLILSTALPYAICALLFNINNLVDQRLYNYAINNSGQAAIRVLHWGVYYGKYSAIIGVIAILCAMGNVSAIPKIIQSYERKEYRDAQIKLGKCVHRTVIFSVPCAVLVAVLAEPLVRLLCGGEIDTTIKLVQAGSSVILFFPLAYLFASILLRIRKLKVVIAAGLIAILVHLPIVIVLLNFTSLGIMAVVCGCMAFYLTVCVVCFLSVAKYMQYTPEWIRTFGITVIAAGVMGLIGMLLNKAIFMAAGEVVTLFICVLVCIIVYNVLLIVFRGVRRDELYEMPGGKIIVSIAERLRLM